MPLGACVCCGGSTPSCGGCSSSTPPAKIQVVISGASVCSTCFVARLIGFTDGWAKVLSGTPNGTYCANFNASLSGFSICVWTATLETPIVVGYYSDDTCTTLVKSFNVDRILISTLSGAISVLLSSFDGFTFPPSSSDPYTAAYAFYGTASIDPNCVDGTFSSLLTTCGFGSPGGLPAENTVATGGSAMLVMNGC